MEEHKIDLSSDELTQIRRHGLSPGRVIAQIDNFRNGFPPLPIVESATLGNGIKALDADLESVCRAEYRAACSSMKVTKFVPASGAATRMFKDLFEYLAGGNENPTVTTLKANLDRFAFADALHAIVPPKSTTHQLIEAIVGNGLNYGSLPKGLILFHKYPTAPRTAFEEHLCEGAMYADCDGQVNIHFTVSPEHLDAFEELLESVREHYERRFDVRYNISFSVQKSSTDTVAVNPDNTLFHTAERQLLFRPSGHGALIDNLNAIDSDLIFVKNIDNVTTDRLKGDTIRYKESLAGLLLVLQKRTFDLLQRADAGENIVAEATALLEKELCVRLPEHWRELSDSELLPRLRALLNRPMRVCAMVRNEGEPGGGPFWVKNADGTVALQIAESAQIAPEDRDIMKHSTHFNPADLVCAVKNYQGVKFDLTEYVDPSTGFISEKSYQGSPLRAQERPGLWNGAMARWNTIFVEVPVSTFTPVKVVTDLLRPQHQNRTTINFEK